MIRGLLIVFLGSGVFSDSTKGLSCLITPFSCLGRVFEGLEGCTWLAGDSASRAPRLNDRSLDSEPQAPNGLGFWFRGLGFRGSQKFRV